MKTPAKMHHQATRPRDTPSPSKTGESMSPSHQVRSKAIVSRLTALSLPVPDTRGSRKKSHHIPSATWTATGMRSPRRSMSDFQRSSLRKKLGWSTRGKRRRLGEGLERERFIGRIAEVSSFTPLKRRSWGGVFTRMSDQAKMPLFGGWERISSAGLGARPSSDPSVSSVGLGVGVSDRGSAFFTSFSFVLCTCLADSKLKWHVISSLWREFQQNSLSSAIASHL
jgi:hypothetical protein